MSPSDLRVPIPPDVSPGRHEHLDLWISGVTGFSATGPHATAHAGLEQTALHTSTAARECSFARPVKFKGGRWRFCRNEPFGRGGRAEGLRRAPVRLARPTPAPTARCAGFCARVVPVGVVDVGDQTLAVIRQSDLLASATWKPGSIGRARIAPA
jgi:hypothetical protein